MGLVAVMQMLIVQEVPLTAMFNVANGCAGVCSRRGACLLRKRVHRQRGADVLRWYTTRHGAQPPLLPERVLQRGCDACIETLVRWGACMRCWYRAFVLACVRCWYHAFVRACMRCWYRAFVLITGMMLWV